MKQNYFLLLLFTFFTSFLQTSFAQTTSKNKLLSESRTDSKFALVYKFKTDGDEFGTYSTRNILDKDFTELQNHLTLVDSIDLSKKYKGAYTKEYELELSQKSEYGYYLIVWTEEDLLKTKLVTIVPLYVVLQKNAHHSWLLVYDSLGNELADLKVKAFLENENTLREKEIEISYNKQFKHYPLPNKKDDASLEIQYAGKTWFLYAEREYRYDYRHRRPPFYKKAIYSFPIKYFWIVPYRQGKKIVDVIRYGEATDLRLVRFFANIFKKKEENNSIYFRGLNRWGYFLTDKIKYRPYDTLRFKGYLAARKGKPIKSKEVDVFISTSTTTHKKIMTLKRYRKGGFEGEIVLSDSLSLKLGQFAGLVLKDKKGKVLVATKFEYQDYFLPNIKNFEMKLSDEKQYRNTPFSVRLSAKDFNNLNILDGKVTVALTNADFHTTYEPSLEQYKYKNLWKHEQKLEPFGETLITIPDSIFPAADLSYKLKVTLHNSNNETKEKEKTVEYHHFTQIPSLETRFEDGFVYAVYKEGKDTVSKKGIVVRNYKTNADFVKEVQRQDSITFPFKQCTNLTITKFDFALQTKLHGEEITLTQTHNVPNSLEVMGNYSLDSLLLTIQNPHKAAVRYSLFQKNKLILQKVDSNSVIRIAIKDKANKPYVLQTAYTYGAEVYENQNAFLRNKKQLFIGIDAPLVTSPSFKEEITVSVKDYKHRPVKNADVTVVSTNSKFEEHTKPLLNARYKSGFNFKKKRFWEKYIDLDTDMRNNLFLGSYKHWKTRFGLDSVMYYDFLFPKKEGFRYSIAYDSILSKMKRELARVNGIEDQNHRLFTAFEAGHNRKKGALLLHFPSEKDGITWIKIDDSLAFYSAITPNQDYHIELSEGKHKLEIRTENYIITIDSLSIPKNHLTVLSYDLDNLPNYVSKKSVERKYSDEEKMMLGAHKVILQTNGNYYSNSNAILEQNGKKQVIYSKSKREGNDYVYKWEYPLIQKGSFVFRKTTNDTTLSYPLNFEPFVRYEFDEEKGFIKNHNIPASDFFPTSKYVSGIGTKEFTKANYAFPFIGYAYFGRRKHKPIIYNWKTPQLTLKSERWKEVIFKNTDSTSTEFEKEYRFENMIPFKGKLPSGIYTVLVIYKEVGCDKVENVEVKENQVIEIDISQNGINCSTKEKKQYDVFAPSKRKEKEFDYTSFKIDATTQMITYTGTLTDENGEALPGGTVMAKGTTIGTTTDIEGNYTLYAPVGCTLVFSYVGYGIEEREATSAHMEVQMNEGTEALESVVVTGYAAEKKSSMAYSVSVVNSADITALQGQVAGVQIQNIGIPLNFNSFTLENPEIDGIDAAPQKKKALRNYFTDNAIWQPTLKTDKNGKASFMTTFPDNITSWKTFAIAYGKKWKNGQALTQTNSFLSLSAELSLPRFLLEGDSVRVIGKINSYSSDSVSTTTFFSLDDKKLEGRSQHVLFSYVDSLRFKAKDYSIFSSDKNSDSLSIFRDSLKISYAMNANLKAGQIYTDGEERKIPIYRKGLLKKRGFFAILEGDTTLNLSAFKDSLSSANPVKVTVQDNILEAMVLELENIQNYAYACNEQKASKIKAYILEKEIKEKLGKPFEKNKQRELEKLIKKLVKAQYDDGLWGWWESSAPNVLMTAYIYGVLYDAKEKGFDIPLETLQKAEQAIAKDTYVPYLYQKASLYRSLATNKKLISTYKKQAENIADSLEYYENKQNLKSLYSLFSIIRLRQLYDLPYSLDILKMNRNQTQFDGIYWKEWDYGWRYYSLFENNNQITLLAYQILRDAKKTKPKEFEKLGIDLAKVRQYFLEERNQNGYWRNTHESASILSTILLDFEEEYSLNKNKSETQSDDNDFETKLFWGGKEWKAEKLASFSKSDLPNEISKKGSLPVFISLSQEYFEEKPKQKIDGSFRIKTYLEQDGRREKLDSVYLEAGKKLTLTVELTVTKQSEYVAIEVPIPASCVYGKNPYSFRQNYFYYYRGIETYREEFKHKTAIFCTQIPVGTHTFEIVLEPRYSGVFTLNPASVELMYFPNIAGNEGTKKIFVE
ncbi:carboxypeptidase-like regulatory domain-containing protein [Bernardetia sp.]|uniref:carboxypeptidase-like regulatory domain-containing protein n=1 Tax=Bernardetia sp. TaxID=1937974 RepID=UPI0025BA49B8|nr:carboxypeptidase-like regulatory domain-containing protein [Bernardetia sp.]